MNIIALVTGADMTRCMRAMEARVQGLPQDYQKAWQTLTSALLTYGSFSGRNLIPVYRHLLDFMEGAASAGKRAADVFGTDLDGFCAELASGVGLENQRDKWRRQLNHNVARKLGEVR